MTRGVLILWLWIFTAGVILDRLEGDLAVLAFLGLLFLMISYGGMCARVDELEEEITRLKSGDFTEEEFQNLCHNFDESDKDRLHEENDVLKKENNRLRQQIME